MAVVRPCSKAVANGRASRLSMRKALDPRAVLMLLFMDPFLNPRIPRRNGGVGPIQTTRALGLVALLLLTGCGEEMERLRSENAALQSRVEELEIQNREAEDLVQVSQDNTGELQRIIDLGQIAAEETRGQVNRMEREVAALKQERDQIMDEYARLEEAISPQVVLIELLRRHFRKTMVGSELGDLTLRDGTMLQGAVIAEIQDDEKIRLRHGSGVGVYEIADLPEAARRTLLHGPDVAQIKVDPKALLAGQPLTTPGMDETALQARAQALAEQRAAALEARKQAELEKLRQQTEAKIKDLQKQKETAKLSLRAVDRARSSQSSVFARQGKIRTSPVDRAKAMEKFDKQRNQIEASLLLYESQIKDLQATLAGLPP